MKKVKTVTKVVPGTSLLSPDFGTLRVLDTTLGKNWKCHAENGRTLTLSDAYLKGCVVIKASKADPTSDEPESETDDEPIVDGDGNVIREIGQQAEPIAGADTADVLYENEDGSEEPGVIEDDDDAEDRRAHAAMMASVRDEEEEQEEL